MVARFVRPPVLEARIVGLKGEGVQRAQDGWRFGGFVNFGRSDFAGWKVALVLGMEVSLLPVLDILEIEESLEGDVEELQVSSGVEREFHKLEVGGSTPPPAPSVEVVRYELSDDGKGLKAYFREECGKESYWHVHSDEMSEFERWVHGMLHLIEFNKGGE